MFKFAKPSALLFGLAATFAALTPAKALPPPIPAAVSDLDLSRYQGIWYEIAHFRESPRDYAGARNAFSRYILEAFDDTRLRVVDEYDRLAGLNHGRAYSQLYAPDPSRPGELVRAGRSLLGRAYTQPYHVFAISEDYTHAVVGEPSGSHLYILSRTPYLKPLELAQLVVWLRGHAAYSDVLERLHCTTQSYKLDDKESCAATLKRVRDNVQATTP